MKNCRYVLGIVALVVLSMGSCMFNKAKTALIVSITSDLQGGRNVTTLSCTFQGHLDPQGAGIFGSKDVHPITATLEAWWEDSNHQNAQVLTSRSYTFTSDTPASHTATESAPAGYAFTGYFWVEIKWTDEDGTSRTVKGAKVYCYV